MRNLMAYVPTLNQRHLNWFERHPHSVLFLIRQEDAEKLLSRLARNMAALPTNVVMRIIRAGTDMLHDTRIIHPDWLDEDPNLESPIWKDWVMPDEDVSHLFAERYLYPAGCNVEFEMIWARYDMTVVKSNQPVITDAEISTSAFDQSVMQKATEVSQRSPDWWRQVGAVAVSPDGKQFVVAYNTHMPNEYETYIFGDPGINRDAGEVGKYTGMHSEEAVIAQCAGYGPTLAGWSMYVTTFPCEKCARLICSVGVKTVFYREGFSSFNAQDDFRVYGVRIVRVDEPPSLA